MKRVLVLAAALAMAVVGTAQAASTRVIFGPAGGRVEFRAAAGERNTIKVSSLLGTREVLTVVDSTAPTLTVVNENPWGSCLGPGVLVAVCQAVGYPLGTWVQTSDGNDRLDVSRLTPLAGGSYQPADDFDLGDGNDVVVGNGTPYDIGTYIQCGTGYDVVTNAGQARTFNCESVQR